MVRVLFYTHESMRRHDTGDRHPERPARLDAVIAGAERSGVELLHREAPEIALDVLAGVHDVDYVQGIHEFCAGGGGALDADTVAVPASWEAALRAAGAGPASIAALRAGEGDVAFLAVRPPGHHASAARAMGFCLFNNVAVAADALSRSGERVAIVDWDVHHGNGTQDTFYGRADVLYVSFHEFPAYPGTGWLEETGHGDAAGTTLNFPFPAGTAGDVYRKGFEDIVGPVLEQFTPDWVLVSAGYDGHAADPLAGLRLEASDYWYMAEVLAGAVPSGRLVLFLEGGYDLPAVEAAVAATLAGCAGDATSTEAGGTHSPSTAWRILELVSDQASRTWEVG